MVEQLIYLDWHGWRLRVAAVDDDVDVAWLTAALRDPLARAQTLTGLVDAVDRAVTAARCSVLFDLEPVWDGVSDPRELRITVSRRLAAPRPERSAAGRAVSAA